MIRIVKRSDGRIAPDQDGKADGRGAYICRSVECFTKMQKTKALNRTFKMQVPDDVYDSIRPMFDT
jgi:hypothetical protein